MNCFSYIKSDLYRYAGNTTIKSFIKHYIKSEGFKFSVWLRICYFLRKKYILKYSLFPFAVIMYKHYRSKYGYDIPYSIEIGPGLLLFHINGIVISAKRIGKNATISHCTTIGMKIIDGVSKFPEIGDNLYLAPGAKIVGGIKVGDNVAVGTNSVLINSVESNSIVLGIPGKVVSNKNKNEYIINPIK